MTRILFCHFFGNENITINSKEWKIKHFKKGWTGLMWCYVFPEVRRYCGTVLTNGFRIKNMVTVAFLFLLHQLLLFQAGWQRNCINKPVILLSCVFRKKNLGSEIGRLKEGHSCYPGEYKSIKFMAQRFSLIGTYW